MARAYAKFWRDLDSAGLTSDHKACALYCHILCNAIPVARSVVFHGTAISLQSGQMVTSRAELALRLGLTEKEIRRASSGLEKLHLVGQMRAGKYTVFYLMDSEGCSEQGPDEGQVKGQMRAGSGPDEGPALSIRNRELRADSGEFNINSASGDAPEAQAKPRRTSVLSGWKLETFNVFWKAYGWMKGRGGAEKAWAAIPNLDNALVKLICDAARKEAAQRQAILDAGRTPKWAQGWLNERRWEDDYSQQEQTHRPYVPQSRQGERLEGNSLTASNLETVGRGMRLFMQSEGFSQEEIDEAIGSPEGREHVTVQVQE